MPQPGPPRPGATTATLARRRRGCDTGAILRARVSSAYVAVFVVIGVAFPYLPLWLSSAGLDARGIALVIGLQPLLRWGSGLLVAALADRLQMRHALVVVCGVAGACCYLPMPFVRDAATIAALIAASSVFHGPLVPLVDAVVLDHLDVLGGDYGRLRVAGSVAFIVGAVLAAACVTATSVTAVPWLFAVAQLAVVPAVCALPRGQRAHAHEPVAVRTLLTPAMRAFSAHAFLLQASCGVWMAFFALHVQALGLSPALPGVISGLAVVLEVLLFTRGPGVLARWSPPALLLLTTVITVVRWLASAWVTGATPVTLVQCLHAFTFSVFHLTAQRLLVALVPPGGRTSGQGIYGFTAFGAGTTAGVWLIGPVVDGVGTRGAFVVEAVVALVAAWPALVLARRTRDVDWRGAVASPPRGRQGRAS